MITRLSLLACAVGIAVALATATAVHAKTPKPHRLAPATSCTAANRMDIFIDEDGIMYECQCQMLKQGTLCAWQVIGGTDPVPTRKIRRHHHKLRIIAYTIPAVTA